MTTRMPVAETIAVIDLGTNTFHVLIIEITPTGEMRVIDKFREAVKLGEGGFAAHTLAPEAYQRGMQALLKIKTLLDSKPVSRVLAFATSAIRSADNGKDFVAEAYAKTGIEIQVINGNEEAALIYQGVKYGLALPVHQDVLIVDIGGGSVEFIVGNRQNAKLLRSVNIGAQRMTDITGPFDQISPAQIQSLIDCYDRELHALLTEIKEFRIKTLIGSSGTFETFGVMAAHDAGEKNFADNLNGYRFDVKRFKKLAKKLISSTRAERLTIPGMEALRVDMILMGTVLTDFLVERLGIEEIQVSSYALKEGILSNYLNEQGNDQSEAYLTRDPREQSVVNLAVKFGCSIEKADYTSRLALSLFDQTQMWHNFGADERQLLHFSTLLVDVGHYIQRSGHHKHGQYIIQNCALPGFSGKELLLMANLVRYHRKSLPSLDHLHYNVLYKEDKNIINKLGGILRLAVNLNRGNRKVIQSVTMHSLPNRDLLLKVYAPVSAQLEIEAAMEAKEMFEKAFETRLTVVQGG
jgi:exopolyphosphatase/guanosine-5'-triphosphate,3'-diphosphate pyrophosphatase